MLDKMQWMQRVDKMQVLEWVMILSRGVGLQGSTVRVLPNATL